ncbi:MAG TPA: phytanoyl-CoA dioxygenase family protein [Capsulimonadaceae bacterium]|nr:phytanoyl-CoA dioxygenase family protein [Capsulimonadaceae bacterium]
MKTLAKTQLGSLRRPVSVEEYIAFRKNGFLAVRGLVSDEEIQELRQHTDDLMQGRLPQQNRQMAERDPSGDHGVSVQDLEAPPAHLSPEEKAQFFLRIHMLHRKLELHERYLLHSGVLDILEVLIGPDILAMQSMLFLKPAGKPGQGWHQDSYYIPTLPDTLCGAWIAIDDADELNGAMWMAKGSNVEPIYPPCGGYGYGDRLIQDIPSVDGVSDTDDEKNDLSRIADKYDQVLVSARAGDVVFFGGHILHRSKKNFSPDRCRRSFVGHYCNARSFTQWGGDTSDPTYGATSIDQATGMTNGSHILARGDTHLPFARPRFGTPCAALLSPEERRRQSSEAAAMMGDMESGLMGNKPNGSKRKHD